MKESELLEINRRFFGLNLNSRIKEFPFLKGLLTSVKNSSFDFKIESEPKSILRIETSLKFIEKELFVKNVMNGMIPKISEELIYNLDEDNWNRSHFVIDGFIFDFKIETYQTKDGHFILSNCWQIPADSDLTINAKLKIWTVIGK
jgi:hypothetical protein